jgi:hypothetical protein
MTASGPEGGEIKIRITIKIKIKGREKRDGAGWRDTHRWF